MFQFVYRKVCCLHGSVAHRIFYYNQKITGTVLTKRQRVARAFQECHAHTGIKTSKQIKTKYMYILPTVLPSPIY